MNPSADSSPIRNCGRKGCPAFAHGVLRLNIPPIGISIEAGMHIGFIVGIELCAQHVKEAKPFDFMTPAWRQAVRDTIEASNGKAEPDFERAWLALMPLNAPEYLMWQRDQVGSSS